MDHSQLTLMSDTQKKKESFDPKKVVFRPAKTSVFWVMIQPEEDLEILRKTPTASNYFYVTKDKDYQPLKRYFELVDHYLVMRKSADKVPIDYLDLTFLHVDLVKEKKGSKTYYILRLCNIQMYDALITNDERIAYKWYFLLTQHCVGIEFKQMYHLHTDKSIGSGAFGCVFFADLNIGGFFGKRAVKVYSKESIFRKVPKQKNRDIARKSIVNEVNILRKLDNPHVLKLYEVYEDQSSKEIYMVTEAYFGDTLGKRLSEKQGHRFSIWDCLQIIKRILKGVAYLHDLKIIHRDLKPANIVFKDSDGSYDLAIIDFGFATEEHNYNRLFTQCGTKGYVAPEMITKLPYNCKSDMFAVGVIFYEIFTGHAPFYKAGDANIYERNKEANPTYDWKELDMEVTEEQEVLLLSFMKKLITRDPAERMSAKEALEHPLFSLLQSKSSTLEQSIAPRKKDLVGFLNQTKNYKFEEENPDCSSEEFPFDSPEVKPKVKEGMTLSAVKDPPEMKKANIENGEESPAFPDLCLKRTCSDGKKLSPTLH